VKDDRILRWSKKDGSFNLRGYKYNYHFYNVLRLSRIDHLQPTLSFKTLIDYPRLNQNQSGEVWGYKVSTIIREPV
jgi:hypothetical protein